MFLCYIVIVLWVEKNILRFTSQVSPRQRSCQYGKDVFIAVLTSLGFFQCSVSSSFLSIIKTWVYNWALESMGLDVYALPTI